MLGVRCRKGLPVLGAEASHNEPSRKGNAMKTTIEAVEGTGEEISRYAGARPYDKFLLVAIEHLALPETFDETKWNETIRQIDSLRGLFHELPDESYSTDALYN